MACNACKHQNNQPLLDYSKSVNLFKFNSNRDQIKDPNLPDSIAISSPPVVDQVKVDGPPPTPVLKKDLPSIKKMAFSLTEAIKDNIKQAVTGGAVLATPDILLKRMDTCAACDFFIADQSRCSKCGCYMNIKARMQVSSCPLNKW